MTERIPLDDLTSDQLDQLYNDLDQAEADLALYAEAESADAAAGSYALRAEGVEATLDRARQYARTEQELGNAITPDDLLAILNEDQAQAASCSPAAAETEPNNPAATEATDTWKEPTHPHPCTAAIEGRATPGGRRVQCTREARHPENHVGPKQGANGRVLWSDWSAGATPHEERP